MLALKILVRSGEVHPEELNSAPCHACNGGEELQMS